jgi:hypothetical protein
MCQEPLLREYFELLKVISDFDGRLLLIKGWGVTFGLATFALGFQKRSAGVLLVAALSGVCFWTLEAEFKGYQMRYYPRMRHIEVVCAQTAQSRVPPQPPGPLIDWSWDNAPDQLRDGRIPDESRIQERTALRAYRYRMLLPQVFLPHVITVIFSVLVAFLVRRGRLSAWGERS